MWSDTQGFFYTGTQADGCTINTDIYALDPNSWGIQAFYPELGEYTAAATWAENNCATTCDDFWGFDFNTDRDGVWFEGTAQMGVAYRCLSNFAMADKCIAELRKAQLTAQNTDGKGIVAACKDGLSTGLDWEYDARLYVGATCWYIFAELGYNPFADVFPVVQYTWDTTEEGWAFQGSVSPFDSPMSTYESGHLGLTPDGSTNCFSFWYSPDIQITDGHLYQAKWLVGSSVSNPDVAVQFRLRVNQKGAWQSWDRVVNSNYGQAPSAGNDKDYYVFFNPKVTGFEDNLVVFNFDIMSFDPGDDTSSWLYLEELVVDGVSYANETVVASYDFATDSEGWQFAGAISPYDTPASSVIPDYIGLSPNGFTNCFSYWYSPDVGFEDGKIYRARFEMSSNVANPDDAVQFRLRVNQKGSWQGWNRVINSYNQQAPSASEPKTYDVIFNPNVTGSTDNLAVISFDILSFDPADDTSSWLYLDSVRLEEISLLP